MYTMNASSEGVVSCLGSTTTLECAAGIKMVACPSHSLQVVSVYAHTLHTKCQTINVLSLSVGYVYTYIIEIHRFVYVSQCCTEHTTTSA